MDQYSKPLIAFLFSIFKFIFSGKNHLFLIFYSKCFVGFLIMPLLVIYFGNKIKFLCWVVLEKKKRAIYSKSFVFFLKIQKCKAMYCCSSEDVILVISEIWKLIDEKRLKEYILYIFYSQSFSFLYLVVISYLWLN